MNLSSPIRHGAGSILSPMGRKRRGLLCLAGALALAAGGLLSGCGQSDEDGGKAKTGAAASGLESSAQKIAADRGLTPDDVKAALSTYLPSGKHDDYVLFASGGHSGQVFAVGVPSMRLLRSIAVFTPEPWQGYGYGTGNDVLAQGAVDGKILTSGDTHHPAISQTNGDYDGEFLFIGDKANGRMAVIDLRDWETKQIVKNPLLVGNHGGAVVTPNSEYVIEGAQYAQPLGWDYAPLEEYKAKYRGLVTFWKFDRKAGRIDTEKSFAVELPPYWQDLFAAGRGPSEGWVFGNSFNTEMATGGIEEGKPPIEAGASQRDTDFLHIFNLRKAEKAFQDGNVEKIKGMSVIRLKTAVDQGILYLAPENKSPHGVDVTPKGEFIVVAGKLDPHVTVYSFDKIQKTIAENKFSKDEFGVPILDFDSTVEARVEVGLGPLHTQFDDKGYAYTSLFLDSAVARWSLGGSYASLHPEKPWTVVAKTPVQYNVGHICVAGGDTAHPDGKYLVALNKWSVDRFVQTGPLLPQNLQLLDIAGGGERMPVLMDMPFGVGEPHYGEMIAASKLKSWAVYPQVAWDPRTQSVDPKAPVPGKEQIVRNGGTVEVYMTAVRSHFTPEHVHLKKGDHVIWHITNPERAVDATHGFTLSGHNISLSLEPGETDTFEFVADKPGTYPYYCVEFCSALHLEMAGYMLVEP